MYNIEKRSSGYILTFGGVMDKEEMQKWVDESKEVLSTETSNSFGVIIDMKELKPIDEETQAVMVAGQGLYKDKGMHRSAVIVADTIVCMQFKRLAKESGIYATERYIDASITSDPVGVSIKWVNDEIDPDQ